MTSILIDEPRPMHHALRALKKNGCWNVAVLVVRIVIVVDDDAPWALHCRAISGPRSRNALHRAGYSETSCIAIGGNFSHWPADMEKLSKNEGRDRAVDY